jgi:hypothetical protein
MTKPTREDLIRLWAEKEKAYTDQRAAFKKYEAASKAYWEAWEKNHADEAHDSTKR